MQLLLLMPIDNHNRILIISKKGPPYCKSFDIDKYSAKRELKKERLILTKQYVAFIISFVIW